MTDPRPSPQVGPRLTGAVGLNVDAPPYWYEIDSYAACFAPAESGLVLSEPEAESELTPDSDLVMFRRQIGRLVQIAQLRTTRDKTDLPQMRKDAAEFLTQLCEMQPGLDALAALDDFAAVDLGFAFQPREAEGKEPGLHGAVASLAQILEAARNLHEWVRYFESEFELVSWSRNAKPLPKHLAAGAVGFYKFHFRKPPPGDREHWLGAFLAALWRDLQLDPMPGASDTAGKLAWYFGRKIEEIVHSK